VIGLGHHRFGGMRSQNATTLRQSWRALGTISPS
jgi:hypothetical protein